MEFITDLSVTHYLYLLAVMAFAGLIHGAMGVGFPMVATPLIAVVMDVRLAILFTLLPTMCVNVASIWGGFDYKNSLRQFWPLFCASLLGSVLGSYLLVLFDPSPFRLALAALILISPLISILMSMSNRFSRTWITMDNYALMIGFGVLAGISAGTTNVMVAVLIIYLLGIGLNKPKMIPILNTCFLIGKVAQVGVLSIEGFLTRSLIYETIPLSLMALMALFVGQRIGKNMAMSSYRIALYLLLAGLALTLISQFFMESAL